MHPEFGSASLIIVIITALTSYFAFNNWELRQRLLFRPILIDQRGEWYRFLSHGLIHADMIHLIFNMYVMYEFGRIVEQLFRQAFGPLGTTLFVIMYVSALIIASIPSYLKHQHSPGYASLGASGAVSGVVFALIFFAPLQLFYLFFIIPVPAILFGVGYLWYSHYMDKQQRDNIGHDAHFWGAVYGFVFVVICATVLRPELVQSFLHQLTGGIL